MSRDVLDNAIESLWGFILLVIGFAAILVRLSLPLLVIYVAVHFVIKFW